MRTYLECIPCFFKQALNAGIIAGADDVTQKEILDRVSRLIPHFGLERRPPEMGRDIYALVREVTGNSDPFKKIKEEQNKAALALYPELKKTVKESDDPLLTAVRLSIAGNIIDYGTSNSFNNDDIGDTVKEVLEKDFAVFDYEKFKTALQKTSQVLYLADNAGEVAFDRILIEELGRDVIYSVKSEPIINDALVEDAVFCGIDKIARVIKNGCDAPGTLLNLCSKEFLDIYNQAELIISKGQGNFEALSDEKRPIFYLFMVKCSCAAEDTGCEMLDIIFKSAL